MFCHRLAHENHEKLAAFATVDATMPYYIYNKYETTTNLPVLMITATKIPKYLSMALKTDIVLVSGMF